MSRFDAAPSSESSSWETPPERIPVGIRTIGKEDPRTLSKEGLEQHPDLLFHGAIAHFEFDPQFDYSDPKNIQNNLGDGSLTLGAGFYAIPSREAATGYALVRMPKNQTDPAVLRLLPYQARMLDLRSRLHPETNGDLPQAFFEKWRAVFTAEVERRAAILNAKEKPTGVERGFQKKLKDYQNLLDQLAATKKTYPVRVILGTETDPTLPFPTLNMTSPPWVGLWSRFMKEQGVDGLICHEGSEELEGANGTTYVFYNLKKIDTVEHWQKAPSTSP